MKQKTKLKNQKRKKPEMVRKSELIKLESYLGESNQLVESLRKESKEDHEYNQGKISKLEDFLKYSHDEQERFITVISSLGKTIQNLERIIQNRSRNFNFIENSIQATNITDRRREF